MRIGSEGGKGMAGKGKELAKNTAIISIGKLCTQAVSFLLLPVYTGILSTEEYGTVDLFLTCTSLLLPIITLQLEQALFRFLLEKRGERDGTQEVLSAVYSITFLLLLIFSAVYLTAASFIRTPFRYCLLGNLISGAFLALMLQTARGLGRTGVYAAGSFLNASSMVILNVFFITGLRMGAEGMIYSHILSGILGGAYVFWKVKAYRYIALRIPTREELGRCCGYALPLVPNQISWWVLSVSDRMVILWKLGVSFNGIYSIAGKFSNLYSIMYNIFNLSWTELVSVHFHDEDREKSLGELQDTVVKLMICLYLAMMAVMPFVFPVMVDEAYRDAYLQIPILLTGAYFSAMTGVLGAYYIADKNTGAIARSTMICAAVNLGLDILLMPRMGLFAASAASAAAYFVMYVIRYADVRKKYGVRISSKLMIMAAAAAGGISAVYYYRNMLLCGITFLGVCVMTALLNRNVWKNIRIPRNLFGIRK